VVDNVLYILSISFFKMYFHLFKIIFNYIEEHDLVGG